MMHDAWNARRRSLPVPSTPQLPCATACLQSAYKESNASKVCAIVDSAVSYCSPATALVLGREAAQTLTPCL